MSTQWPRVAAWIVTTLPTLPGWRGVEVYDGLPATGDRPPRYITVGWVPDGESGNYTKTRDPDGFQQQETGTVRCYLVVQGGDTSKPYRDAMFTLADAFEAEIRRDRTLGGTLSTNSQTDLSADVVSSQTQRGTAAAALLLNLSYFTVT